MNSMNINDDVDMEEDPALQQVILESQRGSNRNPILDPGTCQW